jgi:hypothetical protein
MRSKITSSLVILILATLACNVPSGGPAEPTTPPELLLPSATDTAVPTAAAIVHLISPAQGTKHESTAHDNEESAFYDLKNVEFGDDFKINRFERPFTSVEMNYIPYIDIMDLEMTSDQNWYYVQIKLIGVDPATGGIHGVYGLEFDLDIDGRSEILILAEDPGSEWSAERVRVYLDGNGDIGGQGSTPDTAYTGNGYETMIFDSGQGEDPDLAWARAVMGNRPVAEFGFKKSLLRSYTKFMWSVLASASPIDPSKFYFNDTFTEEGAGSPNKKNAYYPVKELSAYDNTCRVPTGFDATGAEPLGCLVYTPPEPGEPGQPGGPHIFWIPHDIPWCAIFECGPIVK